MNHMNRRNFIKAVAGANLVLMAPLLPGCKKALIKPVPVTASEKSLHPFCQIFGISKEKVDKLFKRALQNGGDFADIYFEHTTNETLKLEEEKINVASASIDMGVGIRVVNGDQAGYAYTESLTMEDMLQAATTASLIAKTKPQGLKPDYHSIKITPKYPVKTSPTEYPIEKKLQLLRRVDRAARVASKEVQVVIGYHANEFKRVLLFCSDGRVLWDARPKTVLGCMVTVKRGNRTERNFFSQGGRVEHHFYNNKRPESIARQAIERATISLEAVMPPAGEMPVVLGPGYSGILLHEAIGHGLEADFNRKDMSIYSGRIGEKVASELCTIVDDGTISNSQGSVNIDDEGEVSQRNVLIEKGVLKSYMHDQISARHYKIKSTGNGRRQSFRHQPMPRMTNTYMLNGSHSKEEVFAGIERGIYAIDFTNGQVNIGPGDYTFFVNYGYLIEKGKITSPIKDVNIIGNGPKSLSRVDRVGNDMFIPESGRGYCGKNGQRVPVNYGVPHLRISKVTVGGRR